MTSGGNVGIGTTTSAAKLEIYDAASTAAGQLRITTAGGNEGIAMLDSAGTTYNWQLGAQNQVSNAFTITPSSAIGGSTFTSPIVTVLSSGNVGIGTTTPANTLEVNGGANFHSYFKLYSSSTFAGYIGPAISLFSSGLTGVSDLGIRPVGGFGIGAGGATAPNFLITSSGNVGIGTTIPTQKLEVAGTVQVDTLASASSTNLCISATSNGVLATCSSSIRYKENVRSAAFGLTEVKAMRPVTFKWKGREENDFGLIAEEIAKINPLFVTYKNRKIEGVKYPQLVAVMVGAIKQQQAEIDELRAANNSLRLHLSSADLRQASDISALSREMYALRAQIKIRTAQK